MAADPKHVKAIFLAVVELAGAARAAFLDQACGDDAILRGRVEQLLRSHEGGSSFLHAQAAPPEANGLDEPPEQQGSAGQPEPTGAAPSPSRHIGPYKLLEQIGEGGMAVVWMAEQVAPVKRLVALKVIKAGMDSAQVLARFEAERQALALMDHPHIAKIFDAGSTGNRNQETGVRSQETAGSKQGAQHQILTPDS